MTANLHSFVHRVLNCMILSLKLIQDPKAKRKDEIYNRDLLKRILRKTGFSKEDKNTLIRLYSTNGLNENNIYYTFDTATIKSCEMSFIP